MTTRSCFLFLVVLAAFPSCQNGVTRPAASVEMPPYKGSVAFERMKSLVGK